MEDLIADYLKTLDDIEEEVEQRTMLSAKARKVATQTASRGGGGHGYRTDRVGDGVTAYVDAEAEIPSLCTEALRLRGAMAALINTLDDRWERKVLNHVLISGKSVSKAAMDISYSRAQTYRIYKRGVENLKEGPEAETVLRLIELHWNRRMRQNETPKDGKM